MKLELDELHLEEMVVWQQKNFEQAIERIRYILNGFLDTDIRQSLGMVNYEDGIGGPRGEDTAAANITHCLIQAVNNTDLRGLNDSAAELSRTKHALYALRELKASMPAGVREALDAQEDEEALAKALKQAAWEEKRQAKEAAQCEARVHEGGRSVGFRRCQKKATGTVVVDGQERRCCTTHKSGHQMWGGVR